MLERPEDNPQNEGLSPAELYPAAAHHDFKAPDIPEEDEEINFNGWTLEDYLEYMYGEDND